MSEGDSSDLDAAWSFVTEWLDGPNNMQGFTLGPEVANPLLLPGRFYGFRTFTKNALAQKIRWRHVYAGFVEVEDEYDSKHKRDNLVCLVVKFDRLFTKMEIPVNFTSCFMHCARSEFAFPAPASTTDGEGES